MLDYCVKERLWVGLEMFVVAEMAREATDVAGRYVWVEGSQLVYFEVDMGLG